MASEAQIRANQENARKSTGPKSDSGKARVAQNARKHGFSAREVIMTCDEDREAWQELLDEYDTQYPFRHAQKPHLITTMANAEMQIRLINRAKVGAMHYYHDGIINQLWGLSKLPEDAAHFYELVTEFLGMAFLRDAYGENVMLKLNRYEAEQQRIWHRAARHIEQLYFRWKNEIVPEAPVEPAQVKPEPAEQPGTETKPISHPEIAENQPSIEPEQQATPEIEPQIPPKGDPQHPKAA